MNGNKKRRTGAAHRDGQKPRTKSTKARTTILLTAAFVCKVLAMGCVSIALAFVGCAALAGIQACMGVCAFFAAMAWALGTLGEVLE